MNDYTEYPNESTFTQRRDFCRHPEYWHAADSDSTEFEVLEMVAGFVRGLQPETVIETGSAFGFGSQLIGHALQANGHGRLYSLEVDEARVAIARGRCWALPVDIVHCDSLKWKPPTSDVGFAFFDSYPELRPLEFRLYYPYMTKGAIVAFHDTGPQHTVRGHVEQLEAAGLLKPIFLRTPRGIAFAEVRN